MKIPHWITRAVRPGCGSSMKTRKATRRVLTLELLEDRCTPAIFLVNTLSDFADDGNPGTMSLREAIAAAGASGGADEIRFGASLNGTITLDSSLSTLQIGAGNDVTISGNSRITLSGNEEMQILNIADGADVTLDGLTLTRGSATQGGAVSVSSSTLTVTNSIILENSAFGNAIIGSGRGGGIYATSSVLTVTNSIFSRNSVSGGSVSVLGGGIYAGEGSTVMVTNSTFSENSVNSNVNAHGGGILAQSTGTTLTVTNSTFSENSVTGSGDAQGGGINFYGESLTVTNSTFVGNSADAGANAYGGGISSYAGSTTVTNSTFSENSASGVGSSFGGGLRSSWTNVLNSTFWGNSAANGGGIVANSAPFYLYNSIVVGSTSGGDISGTLAGGANNIIGNPSSAGGLANGDDDGNIVGNDEGGVLNASLVLDTKLADNGGPTLTHALVADSLAINVGNNTLAVAAGLTTDQRGTGFARIIDSTVDIGAFEYGAAPPAVTVPSSPGGTLPNDALTPISGAEVTIDATPAEGPSVKQQASPIVAASSLTVIGAGKNVTLDNASNQVDGTLAVRDAVDFTLVATGNVSISELDVTGEVNLLINGDLIVPEDVFASLVLRGNIQATRVFVFGTLGGSGTVTATQVTVTDGGLWSVGNSPGLVSVNGDIDFGGGQILVELVHAWAGSFDQTLVVGAASLDDASLGLDLSNYDSFLGESFVILSASNGITGNFANLAGGSQFTQDGVTFSVVNEGTDLRLTVVDHQSASDETFVQQLYWDLLGRRADEGGLSFFLDQLASGASRESIASAIIDSTEYLSEQVRNLYNDILGRSADQAGLDFWVGQLQSGTTVEQIVSGFLSSDEYFALCGSDPSVFVTSLYEKILSRSPGAGEVSFWVAQLESGMSRTQITEFFVTSPESFGDHLADAYETVLRRSGDVSGDDFWLEQLNEGLTPRDLAVAFYGSNEYFTKA